MLEKCTLCSSAAVVTIKQAMHHHTAEDTVFYVNTITFFSLEKCLIVTGFYAVTIWFM